MIHTFRCRAIVSFVLATFIAAVLNSVRAESLEGGGTRSLPPVRHGEKIDMPSPYFQRWPNGRAGLFKLKDELLIILARHNVSTGS